MKHNYLINLEYDKVLELLSRYAVTYIGKELCLGLLPSDDKEKVKLSLDETNEAVSLSYRISSAPIFEIENINIFIKALENQGVLSTKALLDVARVLRISRELKEYFSTDIINPLDFPLLGSYFNILYSNLDVEKKILNSILDENTISDDASPKLASIRRNQRKLEQNIKDKLSNFIHSYNYSKYIQESIVTIRNDRYVIPVKEEYRSQIKGFIHDVSSSGSTVFIEPTSVFDLNNEITNLKIEENIEIERILKNLSSLLYNFTDELKLDIKTIGHLDFVFAKAKYSREINGNIPTLNDKKIINLVKARHPLIDKNNVVPINISIGNDYSTLAITGPNTGGKTVTLKTVGLLTLMACSGLNIPASESSSIYIFDNVFCDIGDEQSIQESLSTFSSHITNIVEILNNATKNSLILIDELGSGTDPIEGSVLAVSILEHFNKLNALTICTTHYQEIKNYALVTPGFKNASVGFDIENLKPTYSLLLGVPGKSNAFAISKKLGISNNILDRAASMIDNQTVSIEDLLKNIYDDKLKIKEQKEETEKTLLDAQKLKKSLERENFEFSKKEKEITENAKIEARKILLHAKEEANEVIKKLNDILKNVSSDSLKIANNLRNELNNSIKNTLIQSSLSTSDGDSTKNEFYKDNNQIDIKKIQKGMSVFVNSFGKEGIILSNVNKSNEVQVQICSMKINVNIKDLSFNNSNSSNIKKQNSYSSSFKSKTVSTEINVIGLNIEEANFVIDKFLDDASLAKLKTIRIVHGKGTGALRKGIHTFLKRHPHVKTYRMGTFGEGEMGVTIVELKYLE